jgi:hypothetical protein
VTLKLKTNRNYSVYKRDCTLLNAPLFTLKFFIVLKSRVVKKELNFTVKSGALRRVQSLLYME